MLLFATGEATLEFGNTSSPQAPDLNMFLLIYDNIIPSLKNNMGNN
jgi:hypothetical protein